MLRKISSILIISALLCMNVFEALLCMNVFAADAADILENTAIIKNSGESRYKAVRLTPEIYNNANSNLSDLRIKDSAGEYVPYFIRSGGDTEYETIGQMHSMSLINAYTQNDNFYFDYVVSNIPNHDVITTSIELTTSNTGFVKHIEVFGSYDNMHWEFVQNDSIYRIDDKSKLNITFSNILKYTHYRFRLSNNFEQISFDSVTLAYNFITQERIYFVEEILPKFSVEEKDGTTNIHIEGLKNLRLAEITIDTDSMFQRIVNASYSFSKELYSLTFSETTYTDTTIPFNRHISHDDTFVLTIRNGDDRPININGIIVRYYADELVFEDRDDDRYALYFGADNTVSAPEYDIERYKEEILKGDIDRLEITEVFLAEPIETPEPPEPRDFTFLFNIAVVVVAVVLGLVILLKLRKKS